MNLQKEKLPWKSVTTHETSSEKVSCAICALLFLCSDFLGVRCSHPRMVSVSSDTRCWLKALPSHPFPSSAKNSANPQVLKGLSRDLWSTGIPNRARVNHAWLCFNTTVASGRAKNESKDLLEKGQKRKNPGEEPSAAE